MLRINQIGSKLVCKPFAGVKNVFLFQGSFLEHCNINNRYFKTLSVQA